MKFFCYLGAAGCMSLFWFTNPGIVLLALAGLMLATIGYSGSIVFYNSYLPAIASEDRQDKVSARGYAFGYIGSTTLLIPNIIFILYPSLLGVSDPTFFTRLSFFLTGLWWLGFAQITFKVLPKGIYAAKTSGHNILNGYKELHKVFLQLKSSPRLRTFLISFFFYIMGVQTVMFMAASFGEKEVHLKLEELIGTVLVLEYLGIGGAFLFARISKLTNNVTALIIAVSVWVCICIGSYFIVTPLHFYVAAFFIGIVMGGIQSLSRSTYGKMIPQTEHNAAFFSFYDVCEKIAIMCGLLMFGTLDNLTGSMRNSISALVISFIIGLFCLLLLSKMKSAEHIVVT
jgi:UMF1 family MFS transporter